MPTAPRLVMKFGGTSVATIERIRNVALRVKREVDSGRQIAVVVSAMAGETSKLVGWCKELSALHDWAEYDQIVSSGELVTAGLTAIALQTLGLKARSWAGWQLPLRTTDMHGSAAIADVGTERLITSMNEGNVAVIAGFQGVASGERVSTLGRGGSDTSAVAIAAALKAERCDIYTDVDGVYTTDPRIVAKARKLNKISYEEMLEMASQGAKVLQTRSVELAMIHKVPVQVLSSFTDVPGTMVVDEDEIVEKQLVSGIAYSRDEAKITLVRVPDRPGVAAQIYGPLADGGVNVDMIVQNVSEDGKFTDMTFTVGRADFERAMHVIERNREAIGYQRLATDTNVTKVSVIGVGMRTHAGVAAIMFRTLAGKGINIQVISTSEIKISVLIAADYTELAIRALHTAYGLDG
ncbi:MAG TPA: aspartate kinase [Alphaproteobacteria bacterium]|nr:aspartate kinase [Alphaproteobacteria bacterium]HAJ45968.1 aspartate kinase [Alphaproteobacteria bacterium]